MASVWLLVAVLVALALFGASTVSDHAKMVNHGRGQRRQNEKNHALVALVVFVAIVITAMAMGG